MQTYSRKVGSARSLVLLTLVLISACATQQNETIKQAIVTPKTQQETPSQADSNGVLDFPVSLDEEIMTLPTLLPELSTPKNPKDFALDLIDLMGTTPGKCGAAEENSPEVIWTCAEYTKGLSTFIAKWNVLTSSAEVSLKHSYISTSDWMYFEIDGEIDFFWKTYDLETTQALVAYDPSEQGNELIIGLNPLIGNQIAAADGSHKFYSAQHTLPFQE